MIVSPTTHQVLAAIDPAGGKLTSPPAPPCLLARPLPIPPPTAAYYKVFISNHRPQVVPRQTLKLTIVPPYQTKPIQYAQTVGELLRKRQFSQRERDIVSGADFEDGLQ